MVTKLPFPNRTEAGKALAQEIVRRAADDPEFGAALADTVVVALPRGGVPVGREIALALGAPLDLILVRKVGVPGHEELAAGAVVNGDDPVFVRNDSVIRLLGVSEEELALGRARGLAEIRRRRERYFGSRPRPDLRGRALIVTDDGLATGATARAALRALRRQEPKALVLALPVAPADAIDQFRDEADSVICLAALEDFVAVGLHYRDFRQVSDEEVIAILDELARRSPA
ncbi:MAG TPA: phosphoribosyltransferase family protein [Paracoccaceae bacterium]|nr:phosphoribosyltransferase family protein [Paracoccaceae bacterium]